jgi:ADP-ribose pyrophosphatase
MEKARVNTMQEIHRARNFSIVTEDVTLPNGSRSEYAIIRHPGSTGIVPITDDGQVIMTHQYRHAVGDYLLEVPAGTTEVGESPIECARRELEEETGYAARDFTEIGIVYIVPAYSDEKIHIYLARGLTPSVQNLDKERSSKS